ncbi:MAG: hypothetical protein KIS92_02765 [Planctomycetota bacterium]|nr:hypothetical protein [Planctomycetota bacterium]
MKNEKIQMGWLNLCVLLVVAVLFGSAIVVDLRHAPVPEVAPAAADLVLNGADAPFHVLDVPTSGVKKVILPANYKVTIAHSGLKTDGSASGASDYVVVMQQSDTMAANKNEGKKALLFPNGYAAVHSLDVANGTDGSYELQLQAVTGSAKIQFITVRIK